MFSLLTAKPAPHALIDPPPESVSFTRGRRTLHALLVLSVFALELAVLCCVPPTSFALSPSLPQDLSTGNFIAVSGDRTADIRTGHAVYLGKPMSSTVSDRPPATACIRYLDRSPGTRYSFVLSDGVIKYYPAAWRLKKGLAPVCCCRRWPAGWYRAWQPVECHRRWPTVSTTAGQ